MGWNDLTEAERDRMWEEAARERELCCRVHGIARCTICH